MKKRFGLYDLIVNGERIYVGVTIAPARRLSQHKMGMLLRRDDDVKLRVVKWFDDRADAHAAERDRIRRFSPRENVIAKPGMTVAETSAARRAARIDRELDRIRKTQEHVRTMAADANAWLKTPEGAAHMRWLTGKS